ncbi:MAG: hypothetical protein IPO40_23490 [Fibrobacteres bacterium]|nr:hypothetical protein [Fibrobacterota bacterium]
MSNQKLPDVSKRIAVIFVIPNAHQIERIIDSVAGTTLILDLYKSD